MNPTIEYSPMQTAIFDWVARGKGSGVVIAVAGAGKTFTIEHSLPFIPEDKYVTLIAFNVTITQELNSRIDKLRKETGRAFARVIAKNFHGLGYGAVMKKLNRNHGQMQVDRLKCAQLFEKMYASQPIVLERYASFAVQLVSLAKGQGIGVLVPNTFDEWYKLIQHHDLFLDDAEATEEEAIGYAQLLLEESNRWSLQGFIDFDDQLYLPLLWKLRLFQVDWVFVDEAQDTNPVRRALLKLILRPGGRLLAVGDPCQAIYGFTGASHDAIDIIKREFNALEMPLTVSYRCSQAVVAAAQEIVDHIQASPTAPLGKVETLKAKETLAALTEQDAILCRNTAPLISLAFKLIASGRGCTVLGREIGKGLIALINKTKARSIEALEVRLVEYREREVAKFMAKGEEGKAAAVDDKVACIFTIIDGLDEDSRTVTALKNHIDGLFSDKQAGTPQSLLTLCTVHKAKGKEWPQVAILQPELMPSKWARQDWQQQQEMNVIYVARTRAKLNLTYMLTEKSREVSIQ